MIDAEVVYALPAVQRRYAVRLREEATVRDAIEASGVLAEFGVIDLAAAKVGVFGRIVDLQRPVVAGDRIEIYRPLAADPKDARRRRARGG
jgi:putative ubiquitin-RnfH superfamily antitoxin RatB of RatAB toxin-antitoxin module